MTHLELLFRTVTCFAIVALGLYLLAWADGPGRRMVLRALQWWNKRRIERAYGGKR